jgi:hypothetical protein
MKMSFAMQHLMNLHADSESDTNSDDDSSESDNDDIPRLLSRVEEGYDDDDNDETAAGDNINGTPRLLMREEESDDNDDDNETAAFADIQVFTADKLLLEVLPTSCWYTERRLARAKKTTNIERFLDMMSVALQNRSDEKM